MLDQYEDIITVQELCKILLIGKNLAYELLSKKEIKAFRIGSTWKIPRASVQEYIGRQSGFPIYY